MTELFDGIRRLRDALDGVDEQATQLDAVAEGLESVRRCNDPAPNGDGMTLCDLWPDHKGPHVNVSAGDERGPCVEWRNRAVRP